MVMILIGTLLAVRLLPLDRIGILVVGFLLLTTNTLGDTLILTVGLIGWASAGSIYGRSLALVSAIAGGC